MSDSFSCKFCNKKYKNKKNVISHYMQKHPDMVLNEQQSEPQWDEVPIPECNITIDESQFLVLPEVDDEINCSNVQVNIVSYDNNNISEEQVHCNLNECCLSEKNTLSKNCIDLNKNESLRKSNSNNDIADENENSTNLLNDDFNCLPNLGIISNKKIVTPLKICLPNMNISRSSKYKKILKYYHSKRLHKFYKYKCKTCHFYASSNIKLMVHKSFCHYKDKSSLKCHTKKLKLKNCNNTIKNMEIIGIKFTNCNICKEKIMSSKLIELLDHRRNNAYSECIEKFKCCLCSRVFQYLSCVKIHEEIEHNFGNVIFECNSCNLGFCSKFFKSQHEKQNSGHLCKLNIISNSEKKNTYFPLLEKKIINWEKGLIFCQCLSVLKSINEIEFHLKKNHVINLNCMFCGTKIESYSFLKQHIKSHFSRVCFDCRYRPPNKMLAAHHTALLKNDNEQHRTKFICDICNFANRHKKTITAHVRDHVFQAKNSTIYTKEPMISLPKIIAVTEKTTNSNEPQKLVSCLPVCKKFETSACDNNMSHIICICTFCSHCDRNESKVIEHMKIVHNVFGAKHKYKCSSCDFINQSYESVSNHLKNSSHDITTTSRFKFSNKCNKCDYSHDEVSFVDLHMKIIHERNLLNLTQWQESYVRKLKKRLLNDIQVVEKMKKVLNVNIRGFQENYVTNGISYYCFLCRKCCKEFHNEILAFQHFQLDNCQPKPEIFILDDDEGISTSNSNLVSNLFETNVDKKLLFQISTYLLDCEKKRIQSISVIEISSDEEVIDLTQ